MPILTATCSTFRRLVIGHLFRLPPAPFGAPYPYARRAVGSASGGARHGTGKLDRRPVHRHHRVDRAEPERDPGATASPRHKNEIKNGAKLIVREGQAAGFVNEGQLADVKLPGMYTLDTKNMPILSTILGWKYGFESPFKCEVYFVSTRQWTDQKWGTQNPIMLRDPEFGPVRAAGVRHLRVQGHRPRHVPEGTRRHRPVVRDCTRSRRSSAT